MFKKFIEDINPAFLTSIEEPPFGSGRSIVLPTNVMGDMTKSVRGSVVDIIEKEKKDVVGKIEDRKEKIIKIKTPFGVYQIPHQKGEIPQVGQGVEITLNRFGEIENYDLK